MVSPDFPTVEWVDNAPALLALPVPKNSELITVDSPIQEADRVMIEARVLDVLNGDLCRRLQRALRAVTIETG